ncbi:hypothetical protein ACFLX9_04545 [Chloroflexota bacterium]
MDSRYERNVFLLLSLYRFVAYAVAVILIQVVSLEGEEAVSNLEYSLLSGIGIYSLLKVLSRLRWRDQGATTYVLLGGDVLICILALYLTGGVASAFLLYSYTPIITSGLLFSRKVSVSISTATCVGLSLPHLMLYRWFAQYDWIMRNDTLPWLGVVVGISLFIALTFQRTKLHLPSHVQADALMNTE